MPSAAGHIGVRRTAHGPRPELSNMTLVSHARDAVTRRFWKQPFKRRGRGVNRRTIMLNTKALLLAAVTALTIGARTAMAQEGGGPSMATVDFWGGKAIAAQQARTTMPVRVQAGASDVTALPSPMGHGAADREFLFGTLANPG